MIRGLGHLALIVPRGSATRESSKPPCLVSSMGPGSVNAVSHGRHRFLGMPDSHFSAQREHIKKWAMQWHFLVLPPCDCIAKIVNNFVWRATFEIQMLDFGGIDNSTFSVMGKKELSDVGQKCLETLHQG